MIRTPMILPHCKLCGNVRFSWKCSVPQEIEANGFFFEPDWDSIGLAAHLRYAAVYSLRVMRSWEGERLLLRRLDFMSTCRSPRNSKKSPQGYNVRTKMNWCSGKPLATL